MPADLRYGALIGSRQERVCDNHVQSDRDFCRSSNWPAALVHHGRFAVCYLYLIRVFCVFAHLSCRLLLPRASSLLEPMMSAEHSFQPFARCLQYSDEQLQRVLHRGARSVTFCAQSYPYKIHRALAELSEASWQFSFCMT